MANGRVLPSALWFDWLLGRAWNMAETSYANASQLGPLNFRPGGSPEAGVGIGGTPAAETFVSRYQGADVAALVTAHDRAMEGQMAEVARQWATEFQGVMSIAAPIGPGFLFAISWLQGAVGGADKLGYLGQAHRAAQVSSFAGEAAAALNARALPLPPLAGAALGNTLAGAAGLHQARMAAQMGADRAAEAHKLRVDAAEALIKARNAALDAAMDYAFTQMHLMFDVFGRNNDFLTRLQREERAIRTAFDARAAELAGWDERLSTTDDSVAAVVRKIKTKADRDNEVASMLADVNMRRLRRYSSRAASALNSAGLSIGISASESNNVDSGI